MRIFSNFDTKLKHVEYNKSKKASEDFLPMKEVNKDINLDKNDPERIICRCEQVRQKEILEALDRGTVITSTDGIKRRTRAGMGLCQGVFCEPKVKEIIAEKYDISESKISTRGKGSGSEPIRVEIKKLRGL